ncbi:helix-turn-helix transcriptional regulator [Fulvivirga sp. M361]|uniref:helix-turn-helix domain-containing protein n=1 Tax=Fulvivirga sp. M361 TaxID=2594266 RepID=UPI00117B636E|nr:helix-turn-helix transcriptional regulator [Fulvivirga sp. M361]TRX51743.1 helix-turn-helix transcriptional regulator [Fulvivirga sp. M361]
MHIKFDYPHKVRTDFLGDVVKQLIERRKRLGITQDQLNHALGVADRLVSHWECGVRSPTAFHLYCWADALKSQLMIIPKEPSPEPICQITANDNTRTIKTATNDNHEPIAYKELVNQTG